MQFFQYGLAAIVFAFILVEMGIRSYLTFTIKRERDQNMVAMQQSQRRVFDVVIAITLIFFLVIIMHL